MRHPGFQKGSKPLLAIDNPFPMELPENLFGEKWAFVQLPISAVREEVSSLETRLVFGAGLDLDLLGIEIDDKTLIPGLTVATSRARPLAGMKLQKLVWNSCTSDSSNIAKLRIFGISQIEVKSCGRKVRSLLKWIGPKPLEASPQKLQPNNKILRTLFQFGPNLRDQSNPRGQWARPKSRSKFGHFKGPNVD